MVKAARGEAKVIPNFEPTNRVCTNALLYRLLTDRIKHSCRICRPLFQLRNRDERTKTKHRLVSENNQNIDFKVMSETEISHKRSSPDAAQR